MRTCPHCKSPIGDAATTCPQCERDLFLHRPAVVAQSSSPAPVLHGRDLLAPGEAGRRPDPNAPPPARVSVVDINMPFGSMVVFMVKWAIAAIPALLILGVLLAALSAFLFGIARGLGGTP